MIRYYWPLVAALAGCMGDGDLADYYDHGPSPEPTAISQHVEVGNVGGSTVSIVGNNFGGNRDVVTVVFGSQNAEIISISDDEMVVRVPRGPIQGGRVNVVVATPGGQGSVPGGYLYDVGEILDEQVGYILLNDQWRSCFGGVGLGSTGGCDADAWTGYTGFEGRAAFLNGVKFPNLHSLHVGWGGGSDMSWGEWTVQDSSQAPLSAEIEDTLRNHLFSGVEGFVVENRAWDDAALQDDEDQFWCAQVNQLDRYRYSGGVVDGVYMKPYEITGEGQVASPQMGTSFLTDMSGAGESCAEQGQREYDRSRLAFCETDKANTARSYTYKAGWPVGVNFMGQGRTSAESGAQQFDDMESSRVAVNIPAIGIDAEMTFPPTLQVHGTHGFQASGDGALWALGGLSTCGDSDGDGAFRLNDSAARLEWVPFEGVPSENARTYVRVSVNLVEVGWFGEQRPTLRASITVPDGHNEDPETGRSYVDIPAWVLYQFPSVTTGWGQTVDAGGEEDMFAWGDPGRSGYGHLVVQIDRITEYAQSSSRLGGDVVVVHASGDFGLLPWNNPLFESGTCGDCIDNDGDGWADSEDPDCGVGSFEDNRSFGLTGCNDGVDNDLDGFVDSDDPECQLATDSEESVIETSPEGDPSGPGDTNGDDADPEDSGAPEDLGGGSGEEEIMDTGGTFSDTGEGAPEPEG